MEALGERFTHLEVDVPEASRTADEHHQDRQLRALVLHRCSRLLHLHLRSERRGHEEKPSKNAYSERPTHWMLNLASLEQKAHFSGGLAEVT
jgi:hypothetical protein